MPEYAIRDPDSGRTITIRGDSPPSESELNELFKAAGPATTSSPMVKYDGIFGSLVPKESQLRLASGIAGSPQQPLPPGNPIPVIGPIMDAVKAIGSGGADIASGLWNHPAETLRGGAAGLAEGVAEQTSPFNLASIALPMLRYLRGAGGVARAVAPEIAAAAKSTGTAFASDMAVPTASAVRAAPPLEAGGFSKPYTPPVRPAPAAPPVTATAPVPVEPMPVPKAAPVVPKAATGTGGWSIPAVAKTADEALSTGVHPAEVASSIEKAIPQTVVEMAKDLRRGYGSSRAGKMLFGDSMPTKDAAAAVERLAPGPSRIPLMTENAALDSEYARRIADPRGGISPRLAATIGLGAAGAAVGGTQGDTTEEHLTNAALGGAAGVAAASVAVPMLASLAASSAPKLLQNGLYTSILARPTAIAKAYLGGVGGAVSNAVELMEAGEVQKGGAILTKLFSPSHVTEIVKAFRNPSSVHSASKLAEAAGYGGETLVGRIFDASNAPALKAMEAGGTSLADAWRYTLSGAPTSPLGKDVLNLWNKWFSLRLGTSLFPRVGIQILERGLERSPAGLIGKLGLNTAGSSALQTAKAVNGPVAALAAYQWGDQVPDWGKPFVAAAAGPYGLAVGSGMAAGMVARRGGSAGQQANAVFNQIGQNTPFPDYGPGEALGSLAKGSMLVPGIVGDIARARDPYERQSSGDFFGRLKAKVPGLRETLPVRALPTNLAGEPTQDRSSAVVRFLTSPTFEGDPHKGIPEPVTRELERLQVNLNPPIADKKVRLGGRDIVVPPEAINRLQQERRQYVVPAIQRMLDSATYQSASDASKKLRLEAVIKKTEAMGSARSKATLVKLLKGAQ